MSHKREDAHKREEKAALASEGKLIEGDAKKVDG